MTYKGLLEQLKDEAVEQLDWFNGTPKTTTDITAFLFTCELNKHFTGDELTEDEAREVIKRTRKLVIPIIDHFLEVDQAVTEMMWRQQ